MNYIIIYKNENLYLEKELIIKKLDINKYKYLKFDFYSSLRDGKFIGDIISINNDITTYNYFIDKDIFITYNVDNKNNIITLLDIGGLND